MKQQPTVKTTLQKILNERGWSRGDLAAKIMQKTGRLIRTDILDQLAGNRRVYCPAWREAIAQTLEISEEELTAPLMAAVSSVEAVKTLA